MWLLKEKNIRKKLHIATISKCWLKTKSDSCLQSCWVFVTHSVAWLSFKAKFLGENSVSGCQGHPTFNLILGHTSYIGPPSSGMWNSKASCLSCPLGVPKANVGGIARGWGRHFPWATRETGTWESVTLFSLWARDFLYEFGINDWWQETSGEWGVGSQFLSRR